MDLRLVIDTSSILSELISFVKTGKSILYEVAQGAFISLYAPSKLIAEVGKKIPEIARKNKLDQNSLIQAWQLHFRPRIIVYDARNLLDLLFGFFVVGKRDIEDVPFVALTFSLKTHGIVTRDKDIIEQPVVRTWRMGNVKKLITLFKKGSFSFFISARFLVPLLRAVFQIGVAILRSLFDLAAKVIQFSAGLIKGLIKEVAKLPDWVKMLLGMAIILMLINEKSRKTAIELLQKIGESITTFLVQTYNLVKALVEKIAPSIQFTVNVVYVLFNSIDQTIVQLRSLQNLYRL
jgi:predicted nucleic acid-binding protein